MFDWTKFNDLFQDKPSETPKGWQNEHTYRSSLRNFSLLVVEGPDAEKFLQGQCTCDFANLQNNTRLLGAHCDHKGRMNSNFIAAKLGENKIGLRVHSSIAQSALDALKKYIVFSKATIELSSSYALLGIGGSAAAQVTANIIPNTEFSAPHFYLQNNIVIIAHSPDCFECWVHVDALEEVLNNTQTEHNLAEDNIWFLHSIQRGEAIITETTATQLLPQEINLQLIGGIAFDKGCYTGQEIIARLHYKGQLKKHLYRGQLKQTELPAINTAITSNNAESKAKGFVVNSARASLDRVEILALCDDALVENNDAIVGENSSAKIQWLPLPYAIS